MIIICICLRSEKKLWYIIHFIKNGERKHTYTNTKKKKKNLSADIFKGFGKKNKK